MLGSNSNMSQANAWDILLFILAAGLVGGFMYGHEWVTAKELAMMLMSAMFGYARGKK